MAKFTSGKWTEDGYGCYVLMVCMMRGWAYLKGKGLSDEEAIKVQEANARLIAAATEMYELLEAMAHHDYDNTVTAILTTKAETLLARIDGEETQL